MFNQPENISFQLPAWINLCADTYRTTTDLSKRMKFVIAAAARNVEESTGGPFAAAIFEIETGKLISLGANLVATRKLSILHAEMVAITVAQRILGTYDLGASGTPSYELITSVEPCAMCAGAIPWSGVRHVATGALGEDATAIGFDEGAKPADWIKEFENRDIKVSPGIEREAARQVLQNYIEGGGHLYSSREG
jgi:tRNA(Arg) A34 adenosine deaminase TadA